MAHDYSMELLYIQSQLGECAEKVINGVKPETAMEILDNRLFNFGFFPDKVNLPNKIWKALDGALELYSEDFEKIENLFDDWENREYPDILNVQDILLKTNTEEGRELNNWIFFANSVDRAYRNAKYTIENYNKSTDSNFLNKRANEYLVSMLLVSYPDFQKHYPLLLENKVFSVRDNGTLHWNKTKVSLAQYFGFQRHGKQNMDWIMIQRVFGVKGLRESFKKSLESEKTDKKNDYDTILEIING